MLNSPDNNAPNKKIILWGNLDGLKVLVGWTQFNISVFLVTQVKELDGELTIQTSHNNITAICLDRTVYHGYIAITPTQIDVTAYQAMEYVESLVQTPNPLT